MTQLDGTLAALSSEAGVAAQQVQSVVDKFKANLPAEGLKELQALASDALALQAAAKSPAAAAAKVATFLLLGAKVLEAQSKQAAFVKRLSAVLMGASIPLPRSAKADLGDTKTRLGAWKPNAAMEQPAQVAQSLHVLYERALSKHQDVDKVEVEVDGIMQKLLAQLFGAERIASQEALQAELDSLEDGVNETGGQGVAGAVFSLALNALERLHQDALTSLMGLEEDEEEAKEGGAALEEEDEDDPFFMPLPSAALKMADEKKFRMLAQPIGKQVDHGAGTNQPILQLDEAGNTPRAGEIPSGAAAATFDASRDAAEPSPSSESAPLAGAISVVPPLLTEADFEPVPEAEARTSRHHQGASTKASSLAGTGAALPSPAQQQAGASSTSATVATTPNGSGALSPGKQTMQLPGAAAVADAAKPLSGLAATVAAVAATAANGAPAASASQVLSASSFGDPDNPRYSDSANPASKLQAPAQAAQEGQPAGQTGQPGDEQHRQFVNFLQSHNPQACMFHAQMRLSLEGCRKLANFLTNSSRVRALSLSHNFLGDDGMAILCEGLATNTSVTAIDLPDNNISDAACCMLAEAVKHNTSLTQLQLASNQISDNGATALAQLIKVNKSITKLGLAHNNIGKAGCKALTEAITANKTLQQLQLLPGNPVEEKDAKALAKALQHSKKFSIRNLLGI